MISAAYRVVRRLVLRMWARICGEIAVFAILRLSAWPWPPRANSAARQQCLGQHGASCSQVQGLVPLWIQRSRDRTGSAADDRTGEIQLASGHTEDCKLDDEQRRMRRSADAAHSRPLIGAPPLQRLPIWQKATGTPYVIDLEMETSAAVGVAQTGRCVARILALRRRTAGIGSRFRHFNRSRQQGMQNWSDLICVYSAYTISRVVILTLIEGFLQSIQVTSPWATWRRSRLNSAHQCMLSGLVPYRRSNHSNLQANKPRSNIR